MSKLVHLMNYGLADFSISPEFWENKRLKHFDQQLEGHGIETRLGWILRDRREKKGDTITCFHCLV